MKLSTEQIEQIKSWISKRGFTHTDVQYEILDHVASAIEDKMEEDPDLTLETAFTQVHKSFGVFGFSSIEDSIMGRLRKEIFYAYLESGRSLLASYRALVPIILVLSLITIYQQLPQIFEIVSNILFYIFFSSTIIFPTLYFVRKKHIRKYLSFKMAISFVLLITLQLFNIHTNILAQVDPIYKILSYAVLIIVAFSIYSGTMKMIQKTEKLHELYKP